MAENGTTTVMNDPPKPVMRLDFTNGFKNAALWFLCGAITVVAVQYWCKTRSQKP